jgi:hypothetical protein
MDLAMKITCLNGGRPYPDQGTPYKCPKCGGLFDLSELEFDPAQVDTSQPGIWREFVEDSGGSVRVFSHSKEPEVAAKGFLSGTSICAWRETRGGDISLVRAMMDLLKAGLEDASLTHFAFVSEQCIPVRPWQEMARRLRIDPRSLLNYRTSKDMKPHHLERLSRVRDLPDRCRRMHSQWCLLARDAAECVAEFDFTLWFEGFLAPDEHYIGSVLALRGYDEDARITKTDSTWVKWNTSDGVSRPNSVSETDAELARSLAAFPGFLPANSRRSRTWGNGDCIG